MPTTMSHGPFTQPLQEYVFYSVYARWQERTQRRESWADAVARTLSFLDDLCQNRLGELYPALHTALYNLDVMPSMRLLATAGRAAERSNILIYNCSALPVDSIDAFVETLILSMSGCGVGYSVEYQFIQQLPVVQHRTNVVAHHIVDDSMEGWAEALQTALICWFTGENILFDVNQIRAAGSPLKTKGGYASGPEPFVMMIDKLNTIMKAAQGRRLTSLEVHDMMCHIGQAAVSGGYRRTAMIALADAEDTNVLTCKAPEHMGITVSDTGQWITQAAHRWNANISAVWHDGMPTDLQEHLVTTMLNGLSGEPGIFHRDAARRMRPRRRKDDEFLTNPCGEIALRSHQFCNLSQAVARPWDTIETLAHKVWLATIIGTVQSMATHFPGLRPRWQQNCEEEHLLGVDIAGHRDCPLLSDPDVLRTLRQVAIDTNTTYARRFGIDTSAAITCAKPGGNSAQLLDVSSGIHPRWSRYYRRNVQIQRKSPLFQLLQDQNVPMSPLLTGDHPTPETATTWVIHFPVASPRTATTRHDVGAIEQFHYWRNVRLNWTEHNPSVTITFTPDEKPELRAAFLSNQMILNGITVLPKSDAHYTNMPYEEITQDVYERETAAFPAIDYERLPEYEHRDETTSATELACFAGQCEFAA